MHEVSLVEELVAVLAERCAGERVLRVIVEVGEAAAVLPDALAFAFEACQAGTPLAGAVLEVRGSCPGDGLWLRAVEVA